MQIKVRFLALLLILVFVLQPLIVKYIPEERGVLRLIAEGDFIDLTLVRVGHTQASQLANGLEFIIVRGDVTGGEEENCGKYTAEVHNVFH